MTIINLMSGIMLGFSVSLMRMDETSGLLSMPNAAQLVVPVFVGMFVGFLVSVLFL